MFFFSGKIYEILTRQLIVISAKIVPTIESLKDGYSPTLSVYVI